MNDKQFDELKASVKMMARHMRGEKVKGLRIYEVPEPDVRAIRETTVVSQFEFARLIGINVRALQNWEQGRSQSSQVKDSDRPI